MIRRAIQYLQETSIQPADRHIEFSDVDGVDRSFLIDNDGLPHEVKPTNFRANEALKISTLSALVDYIKSDFERKGKKLIIQIEDEQTVSLKGQIQSDGGRETLVRVNAIIPHFTFDNYYDAESLNIALQARFVKTEDRDLLLQVVGNLKEENVKNTGDDGTSQAVTIKTGIASANDVKVPNPVVLKPYRTFIEVDQPSSEFVFRMKDGPQAALFEADGGAWRNEAIQNIHDFLMKELDLLILSEEITIIA